MRELLLLKTLCIKLGIGLIVFDKKSPKNPNYRILVRAIKSEPDYFYVNKYLKMLGENEKNYLINDQITSSNNFQKF